MSKLNPDFDWGNYGEETRMLIVLAWRKARNLRHCSLCRRRIVRAAVLVPPALRLIEPPAGVVPLPYAVCKEHDGWTPDELGDVLCPGWRQFDVP
jgi:hypothetical protein